MMWDQMSGTAKRSEQYTWSHGWKCNGLLLMWTMGYNMLQFWDLQDWVHRTVMIQQKFKLYGLKTMIMVQDTICNHGINMQWATL